MDISQLRLVLILEDEVGCSGREVQAQLVAGIEF